MEEILTMTVSGIILIIILILINYLESRKKTNEEKIREWNDPESGNSFKRFVFYYSVLFGVVIVIINLISNREIIILLNGVMHFVVVFVVRSVIWNSRNKKYKIID